MRAEICVAIAILRCRIVSPTVVQDRAQSLDLGARR
jgi:hypothetical protein